MFFASTSVASSSSATEAVFGVVERSKLVTDERFFSGVREDEVGNKRKKKEQNVSIFCYRYRYGGEKILSELINSPENDLSAFITDGR